MIEKTIQMNLNMTTHLVRGTGYYDDWWMNSMGVPRWRQFLIHLQQWILPVLWIVTNVVFTILVLMAGLLFTALQLPPVTENSRRYRLLYKPLQLWAYPLFLDLIWGYNGMPVFWFR